MTTPTRDDQSETGLWFKVVVALAIFAAVFMWGKIAVSALFSARLAEYLAGLW